MPEPIATDFTAIGQRSNEPIREDLAKELMDQANAAPYPGPEPVKAGKRYTWSSSEGWIEHDADHVVLLGEDGPRTPGQK